MKALISIVFLLLFFPNQEITEVRELYVNASKSKENAEIFYAKMSKLDSKSNTLIAYKGASIALRAKYLKEIKQKKEAFISGITLLEKSIKAEPENAEIRLIRLSIQENTPKILKYKSNIEEDKKLIITTFDSQPKDLKKYIKEFAVQSSVFSESEKQQITK